MSTLRVDSINARTGTTISVPTGTTVYAPGHIIQVVNQTSNTVTTSTATIPYDNTIPQITEGFEILSVSITPKSANSKLFFNVLFNGYHTAETTAGLTLALFQNGVSNALSSQIFTVINNNYYARMMQHYMTAGTTSTMTFSVRAGAPSGTLYTNGAGSYMGGTVNSYITIMEIGV